MFFDVTSNRVVMFGGQTVIDAATKVAYDLDETWAWNGTEWEELYPASAPSARNSFSVAVDSKRSRGLLFGGVSRLAKFNDTWAYSAGQWTQIVTGSAPTSRSLAGMAYDIQRDRVVLFGGNVFAADGKSESAVYDTWEFDGTNWSQRATAGPQVAEPQLVWDAARNTLLLMGANPTDNKFLMYSYNPADGTWTRIQPTTVPPCGNFVAAAFNGATNDVLVTGGICSDTSALSTPTYRWDGSNWSTLDVGTTSYGSIYLHAFEYDRARQEMVIYGGTAAFGEPGGLTHTLRGDGWHAISLNGVTSPGPRSLMAFQTDPANGVIWLTQGFNSDTTFNDIWKYANGKWTSVDPGENSPGGCSSPVGAFDTDRNRLVVVCSEGGVSEWNGESWATFSGLKTAPPVRRFSSLAYDPNLKKTVLFGGWDDSNYIDQTWTWDGTQWARIRKNAAPPRSLASMWYDPIRKKIVMFGGLGRDSSEGRLTRFNDMWEFNGSGWAAVKPATAPPARYGAQLAVDPRSGHAILFGGLVFTTTVVDKNSIFSQAYGNDTWEWDGATWTKIQTTNTPRPRENGGMAFDPQSNRIVLFGGYAAEYFGETWTYNAGNWTLVVPQQIQSEPVAPSAIAPPRRRSAH